MEFVCSPTSLSLHLRFEEGTLYLSYCYFRMGLGHMEEDIDITHFFQAHYVTAYVSLNCWFQCLYKLLNHCWPLMFICVKITASSRCSSCWSHSGSWSSAPSGLLCLHFVDDLVSTSSVILVEPYYGPTC